RLPGAVGAYEPVDRPLLDFEADVVQRPELPEAFDQIFSADQFPSPFPISDFSPLFAFPVSAGGAPAEEKTSSTAPTSSSRRSPSDFARTTVSLNSARCFRCTSFSCTASPRIKLPRPATE